MDHAYAWLKPTPAPDAMEIDITTPTRPNSHFPYFSVGIGGPVERFHPPISYWGTK